eukprot:c22017_g1_i4 orf=16-342(-)
MQVDSLRHLTSSMATPLHDFDIAKLQGLLFSYVSNIPPSSTNHIFYSSTSSSIPYSTDRRTAQLFPAACATGLLFKTCARHCPEGVLTVCITVWPPVCEPWFLNVSTS